MILPDSNYSSETRVKMLIWGSTEEETIDVPPNIVKCTVHHFLMSVYILYRKKSHTKMTRYAQRSPRRHSAVFMGLEVA
jgi:hypothetical protein